LLVSRHIRFRRIPCDTQQRIVRDVAGRGTDCRDGFSLINGASLQGFRGKLVCWSLRPMGRIGQLAASAPNLFGSNSFQRL
jgi:hypothetical protein